MAKAPETDGEQHITDAERLSFNSAKRITDICREMVEQLAQQKLVMMDEQQRKDHVTKYVQAYKEAIMTEIAALGGELTEDPIRRPSTFLTHTTSAGIDSEESDLQTTPKISLDQAIGGNAL